MDWGPHLLVWLILVVAVVSILRITKNPGRGLLALAILVLLLVIVTGTQGGLGYFSPDTLEFQHQWELAILNGCVPIYRSARITSPVAVIDLAIREGYIEPLPTSGPRWVCTSHWNNAWYDGQSFFHQTVLWRGEAIAGWTLANPKAAKLVWPEAIRLMRVDDPYGVNRGAFLLDRAQYCQTLEAIQELIAGMNAGR